MAATFSLLIIKMFPSFLTCRLNVTKNTYMHACVFIVHRSLYVNLHLQKFFRRGLTEHGSYTCKANQQCEINPRTRNSCRYCRYQKCLAAGMSREGLFLVEVCLAVDNEDASLRNSQRAVFASFCKTFEQIVISLCNTLIIRHFLYDFYSQDLF